MSIKIETPRSKEALAEFVRFYDQVYQYRNAWWPAPVDLQVPMLCGEGPFAQGRRMRPLLARSGDTILARAVAVIDEYYQRQWQEPLGHIVMFEAMPDGREATRALMDAAFAWLKERGAMAARTGFGLFDFPYVIDDYRSLPPNLARHNPAYYHGFLKDAGLESEKGWVDYKIKVRPELLAKWHDMLDSARRRGYEIVPLKDVSESRRLADFTDTWRDTFREHWGFTALTEEEMSLLFDAFSPAGLFDTSVMAYRGGQPVGMLFVVPEITATAALAPGYVLQDSEKLNILGIGVRESARGKGVNLAMAAYAYLELVQRGATYLSYTLVLDDNWPSRRTAEKLGAFVWANYMVYRRNFRQ